MSWEIKHNITAPFNDEELLINGLTVIHQINPVTQAQTQSHYRGTYISLIALQLAIPLGNEGDEALVDAGIGTNAQKYIWDIQDGWVPGGGTGASSFAELSGSPGDNAALASALGAKVNTNGTDRLMTAVEGAKLADQSGINTGDQDLSGYQLISNKRSTFQTTPDDTHYPSEKLTKDNLDSLQAQLNANNTTFSAIYAYNNFI